MRFTDNSVMAYFSVTLYVNHIVCSTFSRATLCFLIKSAQLRRLSAILALSCFSVVQYFQCATAEVKHCSVSVLFQFCFSFVSVVRADTALIVQVLAEFGVGSSALRRPVTPRQRVPADGRRP